jgi:Zn-dependent protease
MIRIPGRIPINIHPIFWIMAGLIGLLNSGTNILGIFIWVFIIFISVLVHEMGHALTASLFNLSPRIELIALGGLTHHEGTNLPFWKQFLIVFNGPLFGFFLYLLAALLLQFPTFSTGMTGSIILMLKQVNLFWTILNLLPVMPLDGGQLLRVVLEGIFGVRGIRYALATGMVVGVLISLAFFLFQAFLVGALFFLFAFQSYDAWRKSRTMTDRDRGEDVKKLFDQAEQDLEAGQKNAARIGFEKVRTETQRGVFYILATQYLAFLKADEGKNQEVYELLVSIRPQLSEEALCLLHRIAFELKDYPLVVELGPTCFQKEPNAEAALRNAYACAILKQPIPTVGWLQTAISEGLQNIGEVLKEEPFDALRQDPIFQEFASRFQ